MEHQMGQTGDLGRGTRRLHHQTDCVQSTRSMTSMTHSFSRGELSHLFCMKDTGNKAVMIAFELSQERAMKIPILFQDGSETLKRFAKYSIHYLVVNSCPRSFHYRSMETLRPLPMLLHPSKEIFSAPTSGRATIHKQSHPVSLRCYRSCFRFFLPTNRLSSREICLFENPENMQMSTLFRVNL